MHFQFDFDFEFELSERSSTLSSIGARVYVREIDFQFEFDSELEVAFERLTFIASASLRSSAQESDFNTLTVNFELELELSS